MVFLKVSGEKQKINPKEKKPTNESDSKTHHITIYYHLWAKTVSPHQSKALSGFTTRHARHRYLLTLISRSRSGNRQSVLNPRRQGNILSPIEAGVTTPNTFGLIRDQHYGHEPGSPPMCESERAVCRTEYRIARVPCSPPWTLLPALEAPRTALLTSGCQWLALTPVILAIGSDGVWWQSWLRLRTER